MGRRCKFTETFLSSKRADNTKSACRFFSRAGLGVLQAKFEALKRKLDAEGLFDPARKRALPKFPRRIGIVTSPSGAAIRDMLNVLQRRAPWLQILISPVRVQGTGASAEIAVAIRELATPNENWPPVDLIIVARGGGSIEDLWEFNEEIVARAIADVGVPIVSAIGHEIDFTIADFVADLRAPTPSAAAELVVPDIADLRRRIEMFGRALGREGLKRMRDAQQQLDHARGTLHRCLAHKIDNYRRALVHIAGARYRRAARLASSSCVATAWSIFAGVFWNCRHAWWKTRGIVSVKQKECCACSAPRPRFAAATALLQTNAAN